MTKRSKQMPHIPVPCVKEVENWLTQWDSNNQFLDMESALNAIFRYKFPDNADMNGVLVKTCVLNKFYNAGLRDMDVIPMARHIVVMNIDPSLNIGDTGIVGKIAKLHINGSDRNYYVFATKYCSFHKPTLFPIYDSFVRKVLVYFKKTDSFAEFRDKDLSDYQTYKKTIETFKSHYCLTRFSFKELDQYLWQLGKTYFK